jgi:hypothetical protein
MQANVLRGKAIMKYGSLQNYATKLGWPPTKLSRILNEKQDPSVKEAWSMAIALDLKNPKEFVAIFCA